MAIRRYTQKPRAKPSMVVRPNRKRDAALQAQMEQAFRLEYGKGITNFKEKISSDDLARAYLSGDYSRVTKQVKFSTLSDDIKEAMDELGVATREGVKRGAAQVPDPDRLRYDLNNPAIAEYIDGRSGSLVEGVTDDFQQTVSELVRTRFAQGMTTAGMADEIGPALKRTIGLDTPRALAQTKFEQSGASKAAIKANYNRLIQARSVTIARTEVAYALNYGQLEVWKEAAQQGVLTEDSLKQWVVDGRPCPLICQKMDGVSVALGDDFLLPDGVTVPAPPAHPNCLCQLQIIAEEGDEAPGNQQRRDAQDDEESDD